MAILSEPVPSLNSETFDAKVFNEVQEPAKKRVSFHTLGCRLNQSETGVLSRSFEQQGYSVVPKTSQSEVCVINTCTVTEHGDAKNRQVIRSLHRKNPEAIIAVVGCYAQIDPETIASIEGVRLVIGSEEKMRITDYLAQAFTQNTPLIIHPKISKDTFTAPVIPHSLAFLAKNQDKQIKTVERDSVSTNSDLQHPDASVTREKTRASLKIQDGCDFMCSFCIIPFARGRSRHRDFSNLQEEARMLVQEGAQEIVITGVNVGTYKTRELTIVDVVDFLNNLPGLARIRISSIEPTTVPETLFQYMSDPQHKLVPFLHLPLQSGSDAVLQKMKRCHSAAEYADEIQMAFETVPDLCIGTDLMVGFPEESEAEFESTLKLLEKLPLAYFHVFPFSARKGTPAFKKKEQVPPPIKLLRGKKLRSLSSKKRRDFHQRFLGQTRKVLWESRKPDGTISGYTDNYIRVDLDDTTSSTLRNQILPTRLTRLLAQSMAGKIILDA